MNYDTYDWRYFIVWDSALDNFDLSYNWMNLRTKICKVTVNTNYRRKGDFRPLVVKRRNFLEVTHLNQELRKKILEIIRREFKDIRKFELNKFDLDNVRVNYIEYFI